MRILPVGTRDKLFRSSLCFHKLIAHLWGKNFHASWGIQNLEDCETMAGTLELASREIYRYNIQGNTAELGVFQGDFAKLINHFFPDRKLYLFDTFEGFDSRDKATEIAENYSDPERQDFSQTSVELVLSKMEHRGNCIVRKGWFPETAEGVDDKFCFVRLDADLYQPIIAGLEFFYPKLVHGGIMMIHDFNNTGYNGVRQAVKEFCDRNSIGYVCLPDGGGSVVIVK